MTLDRPYYYTDNQFFMTDEVDMPSVFDYVVSGGYLKRGLMATFSFSQQRTQGGGDIRRQDMPFVSNRMNFSRVGRHGDGTDSEARTIWNSSSRRLHGRRPERGAGHHVHDRLFYRFHFLGRPTQMSSRIEARRAASPPRSWSPGSRWASPLPARATTPAPAPGR